MDQHICNILMYSHDTYGLGHIRRTMAIAAHLCAPDVNILILTGSSIAGRFNFPEQVDFVRIPGMIKKTNEEYLPQSIRIDPAQALAIRRSIITATAKTFQPDFFIVDKEPLGLKKEVLPTLRWFRKYMPKTRTILGLRDIMDDAETVRATWKKKGIYDALENLYSEIWVYGNREFYDPVSEYAIPETTAQKMHFTGYIPRKMPGSKEAARERARYGVQPDEKLVVVTTGGGGDGYPVMDAFLSMIEAAKGEIPFRSVLITGPFMPEALRKDVIRRAGKLKIRAFHFYRHMEKLLAAADLAVCMGGYNTLCEILSQKTVPLLIPRETPRTEQLIRARSFREQNLADYIPWNELGPEILREKILHLLEDSETIHNAISRFHMTGFKVMRERIEHFRKELS